MQRILSYCLVALLLFSTSGSASDGSERPDTIRETLFVASPQSEFRYELNRLLTERETLSIINENNEAILPGSKSVAKGVVFSAVVPGAGQFYSGSALKGIAFLAIEAAALFGHFHFNSEGNSLENQFEANADVQWSEDNYWDWMSQISGIERADLPALRDYEHNTFSHFLPENKNQQYYENIGKYNQFVYGWRDFREDIVAGGAFTFEQYRSGFYNGEKLETISPLRNDYTELRKDANDNFKRATNLVTVVIFNHLVSAIDAGLTTKRFNSRLKAKVQMQGILYNEELIPALSLGMTW